MSRKGITWGDDQILGPKNDGEDKFTSVRERRSKNGKKKKNKKNKKGEVSAPETTSENDEDSPSASHQPKRKERKRRERSSDEDTSRRSSSSRSRSKSKSKAKSKSKSRPKRSKGQDVNRENERDRRNKIEGAGYGDWYQKWEKSKGPKQETGEIYETIDIDAPIATRPDDPVETLRYTQAELLKKDIILGPDKYGRVKKELKKFGSVSGADSQDGQSDRESKFSRNDRDSSISNIEADQEGDDGHHHHDVMFGFTGIKNAPDDLRAGVTSARFLQRRRSSLGVMFLSPEATAAETIGALNIKTRQEERVSKSVLEAAGAEDINYSFPHQADLTQSKNVDTSSINGSRRSSAALASHSEQTSYLDGNDHPSAAQGEESQAQNNELAERASKLKALIPKNKEVIMEGESMDDVMHMIDGDVFMFYYDDKGVVKYRKLYLWYDPEISLPTATLGTLRWCIPQVAKPDLAIDMGITSEREKAPNKQTVQYRKVKGKVACMPVHLITGLLSGRQSSVFKSTVADHIPEQLCMSIIAEDKSYKREIHIEAPEIRTLKKWKDGINRIITHAAENLSWKHFALGLPFLRFSEEKVQNEPVTVFYVEPKKSSNDTQPTSLDDLPEADQLEEKVLDWGTLVWAPQTYPSLTKLRKQAQEGKVPARRCLPLTRIRKIYQGKQRRAWHRDRNGSKSAKSRRAFSIVADDESQSLHLLANSSRERDHFLLSIVSILTSFLDFTLFSTRKQLRLEAKLKRLQEEKVRQEAILKREKEREKALERQEQDQMRLADMQKQEEDKKLKEKEARVREHEEQEMKEWEELQARLQAKIKAEEREHKRQLAIANGLIPPDDSTDSEEERKRRDRKRAKKRKARARRKKEQAEREEMLKKQLDQTLHEERERTRLMMEKQAARQAMLAEKLKKATSGCRFACF